ncbi:inositol monophosphatase SuhB [Gordonia effusa NBRC 100432]|uniref:Inositol-1-monophosphatase n=1 Tax=Gordonia effusa NBRC 100432 TaxID=1077974 RepID=H0QYM3_9ACTN|nr:inositol monophosphatase family protein [Gordonia effusa]GAB17924.1 inositol monophosphatase SuhB [Gordonia effusa NBRC 100432]
MTESRQLRTDADDLALVAIELAQTAAAHVRRRRPELFGSTTVYESSDTASGSAAVSTKSTPTDPVTLADTETEALIADLLAQHRPGEEMLGEEGGGSRDIPSGVRWVVDPIDGTVNFMYGIPAYAVSVAAQINGVSVAGAVVDVAREITYAAAAGSGAYRHAGGLRERLRVSGIDDPSLALVATGFAYDRQRRAQQAQIIAALLPRIRDIRRVGAAALDLCMVASGAVDAHIEHGLSPWDWAAGGLIAAEAGAVVTLPPANSRATDGHPTIALSPGVAQEMTRVLDEVGALVDLPSR